MATLSVRAVAERARTSDRTVRRWIAEGKLAATKTEDGWTVTESDLAGYLDARTSASDQADGHSVMRPSEAPLLAQLLADTQTQLLQATAAAAMWQARAEMLQGQLDHALAAPIQRDSAESAPGPATDAVSESTVHASTSDKRPWWARAWRAVAGS